MSLRRRGIGKIYQWIEIFRSRDAKDLASRLAAGERSGRPPTAKGIIDPWLDEVIDHDPRLYDYNSTVWTAPLLTQYLTDFAGLHVSIPSVRLALKRLRIKWKHPRYQLSRRSPTWRQAKGGLFTVYLISPSEVEPELISMRVMLISPYCLTNSMPTNQGMM